MEDTESDRPGRDGPRAPHGPSLVPGMVLLAVAAALIVLVLINPEMPDWMRRTVAAVAIVVVVTLLGYAIWVMRATMRRGGR